MKLKIAEKMLVSPWPYRMVRLGLGVLFVWAGVVKLGDPEAFAKIISDGLLPPEVITETYKKIMGEAVSTEHYKIRK